MDQNGSSEQKWTEVDQNGPNRTEVDQNATLKKKNIYIYIFNYIFFIDRNIVLGFFHLLLRIDAYWFPFGYNASDSDMNESKGKSK